MQAECCPLDAVAAIFNDDRNKHYLVKAICGVDVPVTKLVEFEEAITVAMQQALIRYPGTYYRGSFPCDASFAAAVLDHVQLLNEWVIESERPKVVAYEQIMNWYYTQELTGVRDLPPLMEMGTAPALKRKGNLVVNPRFTVWD